MTPKIPNRVRLARSSAGYFTLRAFAPRAKITSKRLSRIERGEADPRMSEAQRIAAALPGETTATLWPGGKDGKKK